ncbi:hypothetical protein B0H13DRAFT_1096919 [Mycena leptocephala]|nr:hypothetical protein B0H13DRAFT_1096919 [Mycena leptocephala]
MSRNTRARVPFVPSIQSYVGTCARSRGGDARYTHYAPGFRQKTTRNAGTIETSSPEQRVTESREEGILRNAVSQSPLSFSLIRTPLLRRLPQLLSPEQSISRPHRTRSPLVPSHPRLDPIRVLVMVCLRACTFSPALRPPAEHETQRRTSRLEGDEEVLRECGKVVRSRRVPASENRATRRWRERWLRSSRTRPRTTHAYLGSSRTRVGAENPLGKSSGEG